MLYEVITVIQAQIVALIENAPGYADRAWQELRPHVDWLVAHLPPEQVIV